jgi:hypothetical protein
MHKHHHHKLLRCGCGCGIQRGEKCQNDDDETRSTSSGRCHPSTTTRRESGAKLHSKTAWWGILAVVRASKKEESATMTTGLNAKQQVMQKMTELMLQRMRQDVADIPKEQEESKTWKTDLI